MDLAQVIICLLTLTGTGKDSTENELVQSKSGEVDASSRIGSKRVDLDFHRIGVEDNVRISLMEAGFLHT
jgi:hypothetical protein